MFVELVFFVGAYNETYLTIMENIVNSAGSHGIFSLIDMHQDAWNAKFCGNGVPDWASIPLKEDFPVPLAPPVPVDPSTGIYTNDRWSNPYFFCRHPGHPNQSTCDDINNDDWSAFYLTYATSTAIGAAYDLNGIGSRFVNYWGKVAAVFARNPNVLGYELMNEPFAGNIYADPTLLIPGVADREKLQPLYDAISAAVRETDITHLILFQGVVWEVILPIGEKYGFTHAPGYETSYANKSVLSWHNSVMPKYTPDKQYYAWKESEMRRIGAGGAVTEIVSSDHCDLLDEYQLSWMHWGYKLYGNLTYDSPGFFKTSNNGWDTCANRTSFDDCVILDMAPAWARTYPKAVAGRTNFFTYNTTTMVARLSYLMEPAISTTDAPTIIFVSEKWVYVKGFQVTLEPPDIATWNHDYQDHITVVHTAPVQVQNLTIIINSL